MSIRGYFGRYRSRWFGIVILSLLLGFTLQKYSSAQELDPEKRAELEQQLQQLEKEAQELDKHLAVIGEEKRTLNNETEKVNTEIKRRELEIKRLALIIRKTGTEIGDKTAGIATLSRKIGKNRKALASSLFLLYTSGQDNALLVLLKNKNLSDFFSALYGLERVQDTIENSLDEFKEERELLEKKKTELEEFEEEQQDLKALQEVERRLLAQKKKEKEDLLRITKGKESLFQQLLKSKQRDIATLRTQLFYLEKTGITAEDAIRFADLAAKRAGIRTAFLLALLEVETGKQFEDGVISVGTNLGTGSWKTDLYNCYIRLRKTGTAESEKRALFQITGALNLDPDKVPVSRKPNYGCGGAMGPAQFLPTTWLRFSDQVAELTGHNPPSPWNVEDAFTAAAIFLSQAGASSQTTAGELRAARTYISGNPSCTRAICRTYSNRIISLARDIDRIL